MSVVCEAESNSRQPSTALDSSRRPKYLLSVIYYLLSIISLVSLDQITKLQIRNHFALHESRPVIRDFFSLTYVQNRGAAWGILAGWRVALVALAAVMLVVLARYREKIFGPRAIGRISFVLLVAGIIGNVIDRVFLGYVVDFLDFYIGKSHFPAFNVADSCICVGVGLYMLASLVFPQQEDR
ncbi:MAG: signal peptidase II [Kiritimatiellae bacterium]|nr:signal peptidase II [Kiritimatiellia bacterium]